MKTPSWATVLPIVAAILLALLATGSATFAAGAAAVRVERSDGSQVEGNLLKLSANEIVVGTSAGTIRLAADELPRVRLMSGAPLKGGPTQSSNQSWGRAVLNDGSSVPFVAVVGSSESGEFDLTLPPEAGLAGSTLTVSVDALRSLRLPRKNAPQEASLANQWADLRTRQPTGDLLVTIRRAGPTLDYLEGFVDALDPEEVTFVLEGEPVAAPVTKVYGIVFARAEGAAEKASSMVGPLVTTRSGAQFKSVQIALSKSGALQVTTAAGLGVTLPLRSIEAIDYSAGRVAHLSDLPRQTGPSRPLFGLPTALSGTSPAPTVRSDRAYWGGPLEVRGHTAAFYKGLAIRSGGEINFDLMGEYRRLRGMVAIDPQASRPRRLHFMIEGDGQTLLEKSLTSESEPIDVDLSVAGVRTLRLRVDRQESLDATLHFGDARLER